jgi:hypothetical protein
LALLALVTGFGLTFVLLSGIGIASGSSTFSMGCDFDRPFDSIGDDVLRRNLASRQGMLLTNDTPIASPPPPAPTVRLAARQDHEQDHQSYGPDMQPDGPCQRFAQSSVFEKYLSVGAFESSGCVTIHVGDARALQASITVAAEGHILVRANEDRLILRVADSLPKSALMSLMLMGSLPRKTRCCLLMLITMRSSVISLTVRVLERSLRCLTAAPAR